MARPISYGLVLEGQDAKDFDEYMANPTFTKEGIALMQRVIRELKEEGIEQ